MLAGMELRYPGLQSNKLICLTRPITPSDPFVAETVAIPLATAFLQRCPQSLEQHKKLQMIGGGGGKSKWKSRTLALSSMAWTDRAQMPALSAAEKVRRIAFLSSPEPSPGLDDSWQPPDMRAASSEQGGGQSLVGPQGQTLKRASSPTTRM